LSFYISYRLMKVRNEEKQKKWRRRRSGKQSARRRRPIAKSRYSQAGVKGGHFKVKNTSRKKASKGGGIGEKQESLGVGGRDTNRTQRSRKKRAATCFKVKKCLRDGFRAKLLFELFKKQCIPDHHSDRDCLVRAGGRIHRRNGMGIERGCGNKQSTETPKTPARGT